MGRITASRTSLKGDPKHGSMLAGKFINCLMLDGKKTTAQRVFYDALEEVGKRNTDAEPIEIFETAPHGGREQGICSLRLVVHSHNEIHGPRSGVAYTVSRFFMR